MNLHLTPNSTNSLYCHVDDMVLIDSPIYLWRWINVQTQEENLIELENLKPDNERFDLFELILPTDLDLDKGFYKVFVYESDQTGRTDFEDMRILRTGAAEIETTFQEGTNYEPTESKDVVYKP